MCNLAFHYNFRKQTKCKLRFILPTKIEIIPFNCILKFARPHPWSCLLAEAKRTFQPDSFLFTFISFYIQFTIKIISQYILTHQLICSNRLREVLFCQEQLYLVFEYLEYDLKKYMKKKGSALPP